MLLAGIGGVFSRVLDLASLSGILFALWFPATAYLFYRAAMIMRSKFGWADIIVCVLGLLTLASVAVSINGRPETLATLIVALGGSIVLSMQVPPMQSYRGLAEGLILGIVVGLCAATSPIVGIGTAGLVLARLASRRHPHALIRDLGVAALAAIVTLCLLAAAFYPYPFRDWLAGILRHGGLIMSMDLPSLASAYLASPRYPLLGLIVAASLIIIIKLIRSFHGPALSRSAVIIGFGTTLGILMVQGFTNGYRVYNFFPFLPLGIALIIAKPEALTPSGSRSSLFGRLVASLVLTFPAIGFIRTAIEYPDYLSQGLQPSSAMDAIALLRANRAGAIGVTPSFAAMIDSYEGVTFLPPNPWNVPAAQLPDTLVVQQYYTGLSKPAPIEGFNLLESKFNPSPPQIAGITVGRVMPGYQYAVYGRSGTAQR